MNSPSYSEMRAAGKALTTKLLRSPTGRQYDPLKAAKKLTLLCKPVMRSGRSEMEGGAN